MRTIMEDNGAVVTSSGRPERSLVAYRDTIHSLYNVSLMDTTKYVECIPSSGR